MLFFYFSISTLFKGCGMGTLFALVSPCFTENVVVTCKIGSFLCSLDNLLQKKRDLKKGLFLTYFWHFLVTRESYKNSFSTYLIHIHTCILLTLLTFFALPILKNTKQNKRKKNEFIRFGFSLVWVLVLILIRAISEQSMNNKMVSKIKLECLLLICVYTNAKLIVICKPRTLNNGGEDSV